MNRTPEQIHLTAVAAGEKSYTDPNTGHLVFTEIGLSQRGKCCGCGCRHCPFDHEGIPLAQRASRIANPAWLTDPAPGSECILFWSGGKDSFLALRNLQRNGVRNIALLTTFDLSSRIIAHQEIPIEHTVAQAEKLNVPLIGVPLVPQGDYVRQVERGLKLVPALKQLAFGDLHLEHIRDWRENAFEPWTRQGVSLTFPVWHADYDELFADLQKSKASCLISAVTDPRLEVFLGQHYDRDFLNALPTDIDRFGENGEFHTRLIPA